MIVYSCSQKLLNLSAYIAGYGATFAQFNIDKNEDSRSRGRTKNYALMIITDDALMMHRCTDVLMFSKYLEGSDCSDAAEIS